jgi:hypothetical protein
MYACLRIDDETFHTDYEFWMKSICPDRGQDYGTPAQKNVRSHTGGNSRNLKPKRHPRYPDVATTPVTKYECHMCFKKFWSQSYRDLHEMRWINILATIAPSHSSLVKLYSPIGRLCI